MSRLIDLQSAFVEANRQAARDELLKGYSWTTICELFMDALERRVGLKVLGAIAKAQGGRLTIRTCDLVMMDGRNVEVRQAPDSLDITVTVAPTPADMRQIGDIYQADEPSEYIAQAEREIQGEGK